MTTHKRWNQALVAVAAAAALIGCASAEPTPLDTSRYPPPGAPAADLSTRGAAPGVDAASSSDPLAAPDDVAGPPAEAEFSPTGLASRVLRPGTGSRTPRARDTVVVHYTGWQTDGTRFDSSVVRGQPATFPLNGVIKGWTEGLQLMVTGEKRRFWIPADLAYGVSPKGDRPAGMLVFDVELLDIR